MRPPERRHQIFISSTYLDLRPIRAVVHRQILTWKHFPAGMEFFPATGDDPLQHIKKEIADSDFYVLIVARRYGTVPPKHTKSYTELEYEYALASGKNILCFLYDGEMPSSDQDMSAVDAFRRRLVQAHTAPHCANEADFFSHLTTGLQAEFSKHAGGPLGWVRCSTIQSAPLVLAEENPAWPLEGMRRPFDFTYVDKAVDPANAVSRGTMMDVKIEIPWSDIFLSVADKICGRKAQVGDVRNELTALGLRFCDRTSHAILTFGGSKLIVCPVAVGEVIRSLENADLIREDWTPLELTQKGQALYRRMHQQKMLAESRPVKAS